MLNEFQKSQIRDFLSFPLSDIKDLTNPLDQLEALEVISIEAQSTFAALQCNEDYFEILGVWDSMEQILEILRHPCPQNRTMGNYMSLHQDPGMAVWYDYDDLIYVADRQGIIHDEKPKVRKEPLGLLSLTSKDLNPRIITPKNINRIKEPVTKKDVTDYIAELIQAEINKVHPVVEADRATFELERSQNKEKKLFDYFSPPGKKDVAKFCEKIQKKNPDLCAEIFAIDALRDRIPLDKQYQLLKHSHTVAEKFYLKGPEVLATCDKTFLLHLCLGTFTKKPEITAQLIILRPDLVEEMYKHYFSLFSAVLLNEMLLQQYPDCKKLMQDHHSFEFQKTYNTVNMYFTKLYERIGSSEYTEVSDTISNIAKRFSNITGARATAIRFLVDLQYICNHENLLPHDFRDPTLRAHILRGALYMCKEYIHDDYRTRPAQYGFFNAFFQTRSALYEEISQFLKQDNAENTKRRDLLALLRFLQNTNTPIIAKLFQNAPWSKEQMIKRIEEVMPAEEPEYRQRMAMHN